MTVVDYAAIAILLGSMVLGMLRGLVRELFNLVGWVVAFFVARAFGPTVAHWLPADLPGGEMTQGALGFLLVLVAVVFGAGIVSALVGRMTDMIGLRPADRGLGMLFGIVRGMLLLMLLLVAARLTALPQQPAWQQSMVRPWVEAGLERLMPYLPEPVQHYLHKPEEAVPSVNSLGTPIPLPRLEPNGEPSRRMQEMLGGQGGLKSRGEMVGIRDNLSSGAAAAGQTNGSGGGANGAGTNAGLGGGGSAGSAGSASGQAPGAGLASPGASDGIQQGWGMRGGGSAAPSAGLHKVSE
ncbi:Colicin V production protein [Pandoraea iniqua]|uniref:Colicin V production protein n=1 Tax=Pandoraea iniqua TaxID=2508288 RepID=A0A5E4V0K8_9BURK|nr:CvpA family protein [Pandoraea iniqua]VVE04919.1 Colicin V production protein [Pandoraea iniqua]